MAFLWSPLRPLQLDISHVQAVLCSIVTCGLQQPCLQSRVVPKFGRDFNFGANSPWLSQNFPPPRKKNADSSMAAAAAPVGDSTASKCRAKTTYKSRPGHIFLLAIQSWNIQRSDGSLSMELQIIILQLHPLKYKMNATWPQTMGPLQS